MADLWRYIGDYCQQGFNIFPLSENTKIPAVKGGNGCLDATHDEEIIAEWLKQYPNCNLGIATGEVSNLIVVDIDVKDNAGGFESVEQLAAEELKFPPTAKVKSPSGGRHLYYTYHTKIQTNSVGRVAPGIDIRSNGGSITAPPSSIDGKKYEWVIPSIRNSPPANVASLPTRTQTSTTLRVHRRR